MGLFDKIFSPTAKQQANTKSYTSLNDYEAWVGVLYACAASDGDVSDVEIDMLSRLLIFKQKFENIEIIPFYKIAMQISNELGNQKLIEGCAAVIKEEDKATVFAMATEIVLADGIINEREKNLLEFVSRTLQIDDELAAKIVEVLLIKNRGNKIITS
ncbi:tellurite resistance TerB family protein [Sediminibacterium ginsengisoli]|uniref:Tellurite resistance protein TerB n=1 Tax=Sediminibacterium ginsengisoli TaxID=413434 RepID=A0A1T4JP84_9BACT|nr:tellurite resistance TerB family protein [Sediminibacterium ginsengisoli]SJZ31984.1 Tellurite resistance protein TerB [Sediminibacterium ginsengisoli]